MYHFFSAPAGRGMAGTPSAAAADLGCSGCAGASVVGAGVSVPLSINQLREVRPDEVEQTEDQCRDDRHDDDDERCRADFLGGRPGDLLALGGDLVGEVINAIVLVRDGA